MRKLIHAFFCIAFGACAARAGTTYYVSGSGSDANDGLSTNAALATLDSALSRVHAGDTIRLGAGTFSAGGKTYRDGLASDRIYIIGSGISSTVITGKLFLYHAFYAITNLTIDGGYIACAGAACHDDIISACEFRRNTSGVYMQKGSGDASDIPSFIAVSRCTFHHPTGDGMIVIVGNNCHVSDCTFRDNSGHDAIRVFGAHDLVHGNTFTRIRSASDAAFSTTSQSSATLNTGTKTFSIPVGLAFTRDDRVTIAAAQNPTLSMSGFVVSYSATDLIVDIDTIQGSGTADNWNIFLSSKGNHADIVQSFVSSFGLGVSDFTFENNTITDCTSQLGNLENDATNTVSHDIVLRNNVMVNSRLQLNCSIPDLSFCNNTVYGTAGFTVGIRAGYSTGGGTGNNMRVYNNLFIRISGNAYGEGAFAFNPQTTGCSADYNIITNDTDGSFPSMSVGLNSINGGIAPSQLFTNPDIRDFTLSQGSPAIDHGFALAPPQPDIAGVVRPQGPAWDIGAFERIAYDNKVTQQLPIGVRIRRMPISARP